VKIICVALFASMIAAPMFPAFAQSVVPIDSNEYHEADQYNQMQDWEASTHPSKSLEARIAELEAKVGESEKAKKKLPNVTVNGVFQADAVLFNQTPENRDAYGSIENGADFRRARLSAKGAVADNMNYFMQMDFGFFGRPTFTDVWVDFTDRPVLGNVRIGQWKQPFGLEVVSSFRYTTFMERSSLFQAFTPFRHLGVGFYDHAQDLNSTWAMSYFRTGQDQFGSSLSTDGGNGLAGRLTHLLLHDGAKGEDFLHIGAGYYLNSPPRGTARFRSIPEIFVGEFAPGGVGTSGQAVPGVLNGTPFFVDTQSIVNVDHVQTFGLESLWVRGAFSLQSEGMAAVVDQSIAPSSTFRGAYTQAGYFLTGEHRPYDRIAGAIDRVIPKCSFGKCGGIGAWEIATRWSYIDLNDNLINGGNMQNVTGGLNWYVNPYCKCVFNYIHSWVDGHDFFPSSTNVAIKSQADAFAMRCQLDF